MACEASPTPVLVPQPLGVQLEAVDQKQSCTMDGFTVDQRVVE